MTRAYFEDDPLNETDPLLSSIEDPRRRATLLARPKSGDRWAPWYPAAARRAQRNRDSVPRYLTEAMMSPAPFRFPRSIATVSLAGTLPEKLEAAGSVGFDSIELFENDLLTLWWRPGWSAPDRPGAWSGDYRLSALPGFRGNAGPGTRAKFRSAIAAVFARDLRLLVGAGDRAPSGAMILRFSERVAIDDEDGIAFGAYLGEGGITREAVLRTGTGGLAEIAVEGAPAPGGGRYVGFSPWPTAGPGGVTAFIAALDGGPGPLAAFAGSAGDIKRVAAMGETLPQGELIGRFALNAVAVAGPGGALTFATVAEAAGERNAICRRTFSSGAQTTGGSGYPCHDYFRLGPPGFNIVLHPWGRICWLQEGRRSPLTGRKSRSPRRRLNGRCGFRKQSVAVYDHHGNSSTVHRFRWKGCADWREWENEHGTRRMRHGAL
jgi:hypothetical protein